MGAWRVDMTGTAYYGAALLDRLRRGDERAAVQPASTTKYPMAPAADDAVAHRKRLAIRLDFHREFGDDRAIAAANFFGERSVFRRI